MENKINLKKQKYWSKVKNKSFKTRKGFNDWLKRLTAYKIDFKDFGQDCLTWYLDEGGEVLHANLQASVWNGKIVDLSLLKEDRNIELLDSKEQTNIILDFIIKKIVIKK